MGAWAQGWQTGENIESQRQARTQQLEDEQRQTKEAALLNQLSTGAITPAAYGAGVSDLYAHEPAESRLGRIGRGLERAVGLKKQATAQQQRADAAQAAKFSPRANYAQIEAGAKTPEQLAAEQQQQQLQYQGQLGEQKTEQERQAAIRSIADFRAQYKQAIGNDPPLDVMQAITLSTFGGPQTVSALEQGQNLKARQDYQNAILDLREKTLALNKAKFDASQDPNNPQFKLNLQKVQAEMQHSQAYWIRAQAGVYGAVNGKPLPGAILDANDQPIGSQFQSNVRPTGTQRERATLAGSALDQMKGMTDLLTSRPDLFGPRAGRITSFTQWVGSQDPDAQKFAAAARTAADHLAGVFGGRSQAALASIYDIIGKNLTNPQAAIAAINQMARAADIIQGMGSYRTVGGGAASPTGGGRGPAPKSAPTGGGVIVVTREDMK
jgi:hypothetical protein